MSTYSVNELAKWINEQSSIHDQLSMKLEQAQALAYVAVAWVDFMDDTETARGYLEALHDLICHISDTHQRMHESVLKVTQGVATERLQERDSKSTHFENS